MDGTSRVPIIFSNCFFPGRSRWRDEVEAAYYTAKAATAHPWRVCLGVHDPRRTALARPFPLA